MAHEMINPDLFIKVLVSSNPRREGSWGEQSFNLYKNGMTVAEHRAKGGRAADLRWDLSHGYISLLTRKPRKSN
jgi:hypothetical protein